MPGVLPRQRRRAVKRPCESGGDGAERHPRPQRPPGESVGDDHRQRPGEQLHGQKREPLRPQHRQERVGPAPERPQADAPPPQRQAAELSRRQQQHIVHRRIQKYKGIRVNGFHGPSIPHVPPRSPSHPPRRRNKIMPGRARVLSRAFSRIYVFHFLGADF